MAVLFGDKERFAAEIGDLWKGHPLMPRVDLWAAGRCWTCDDNIVHVPTFCMNVAGSLNRLRAGCDLSLPFPGVGPAETHRRLLAAGDGSREQYWFARWGPTTDNVTAHHFRAGDRLLIPFEFWRAKHKRPEELGQVFVAELPESELIDVLTRLLDALEPGPW